MLELIRRAGEHAARIAFRTPAGASDYAQLLDRSARIAATLLGTRDDLAEERIAFLVSPGEDYTAVQWGSWRAGGIAVPLSREATAPELVHVLQTAGVERVVANAAPAVALREACAQCGAALLAIGDIDAGVAPAALPDIDSARRAMIVFTSGTTSKPKGVVTTHAAIEAQIRTLVEAWAWRFDDCIPLFLPLHHVHGIVNVLCCALWAGACVEPFDGFRADAVMARVRADACSVFMAVPTVYARLIQQLEALDEGERATLGAAFGRMRVMVSGSAALPATVHARWQELTGQRLLERYGMTEIGMALSNPLHGERRPGSVGVPLPGVEVRLVDETGTVVDGEETPGEIQVRGPCVFREYWNNPEATRASFTADGWFRTGDVGVRERGYWRIMGRASQDIIKSGGYKLSALEIENVLLTHPAIRECAVLGLPDAVWGEVVAACVVLREHHALDAEALRAWCEGRLSPYKQPRRVQVVGALPRNAMGKVVKPEVRAVFL
jgi:malonyl-CoA/methylmalonyl-CoA synthetase